MEFELRLELATRKNTLGTYSNPLPRPSLRGRGEGSPFSDRLFALRRDRSPKDQEVIFSAICQAGPHQHFTFGSAIRRLRAGSGNGSFLLQS